MHGQGKSIGVAHRVSEDFVGRRTELESLTALLKPDGPKVSYVHGIAGVGKSSLLEMFMARGRAAGAAIVKIDCRVPEPTEGGFLGELGNAIGMRTNDLDEATGRLGSLGPTVILVLDTYELYRLMDTWLRQVFVPALPDNVSLMCVGRERPLPAWRTAPGWRGFFRSMCLGPIGDEDALSLLEKLGVPAKSAARIAHVTHGHPLALKLAASAYAERPDLAFEELSLQQALEELTQMFLADVKDPVTRRTLEACSVVRRITVPLLQALLPDLAPRDAYDRLRTLPFVDAADDGLLVHDAVREAIARCLRASDPSGSLAYQKAAWGKLQEETRAAGRSELWRYTADMLYLIENPIVREAFFPSGTHSLAVEPARSEDGSAIAAIIQAQEGAEAARHLLQWWRRRPDAFCVARGRNGNVVGLCCKFISNRVESTWLKEDPVTAQWWKHIEEFPLPEGQTALFCRRWLSIDDGEAPSETQAAIWLDLKRTYLELRPALRRVYLTVTDIDAYGPVATRLGFKVLETREVELDKRLFHSVVVDFGPTSVDGWLAELAATELGVQRLSLLDVDARELVIDGRRVALTPLEFGVMRYLGERDGKAISRGDLLKDVWGTAYLGGSNVVDTVVRSLRRKLGPYARQVETVTGTGYRLRSGNAARSR